MTIPIETECETCAHGIANDGHEICDACATRFGREARAQKVIDRYEQQVRANWTIDHDTIKAVATCDQGLYGAWGEVLDTSVEVGYEPTDAFVPYLSDAFKSLQRRLSGEVAARGQCVPIPALRTLLDTWTDTYGQLADGLIDLIAAESLRHP